MFAEEQRQGQRVNIRRPPAGPGRAGVLRIETDGAVSTPGALIADAGGGGDGGFRPTAVIR